MTFGSPPIPKPYPKCWWNWKYHALDINCRFTFFVQFCACDVCELNVSVLCIMYTFKFTQLTVSHISSRIAEAHKWCRFWVISYARNTHFLFERVVMLRSQKILIHVLKFILQFVSDYQTITNYYISSRHKSNNACSGIV